MKRKHENVAEPAIAISPLWSSLDNEILAKAMSYCDAVDLFSLGRTCRVFREASRLVVSRAKSLHLSVLNASEQKPRKKYHEACVSRLLMDAGSSLQRLELSGLHSIQGHGWLASLLLRCPNLQTLDFSGCRNLDPRAFENAVLASRPACSPIHLNLKGCHRIGADSVQVVAAKWRGLETLELGGCSQTIDDGCWGLIVGCFRGLRVLDLTGLKRITVEAFLTGLPSSLEYLNLSGCEYLNFVLLGQFVSHLQSEFMRMYSEERLRGLADLIQSGSALQVWEALLRPTNALMERLQSFSSVCLVQTGWKNLSVLDVSHCGLAHGGIPRGFVGFLGCFSGGSLTEINISGCENVNDEDIVILATTCAHSLTCLEARACSIGNKALKALSTECIKLAVLDVSACFKISNDGIIHLCPQDGGLPDASFSHVQRARQGCPALRTLRFSNVPDVTDSAILAVGGLGQDDQGGIIRSEGSGLKKLLLLDVRNCNQVSSWAVGKVIGECSSLIEVDARGTVGPISQQAIPSTLRFLNGRRLSPPTSSHRCCTVVNHSQRLKASQGIRLQPMFHCVDCKLVPWADRGICSTCVSQCHAGHETYFGSMARFYCDCAFGVTADLACKALLPS